MAINVCLIAPYQLTLQDNRKDTKLRAEIEAKVIKNHRDISEDRRRDKQKDQVVSLPQDFLQKMYMWMEKSMDTASERTRF